MTAQSSAKKSLAASLGSLAFVSSCLWFTVYVSLWNGFFIDAFMATTMFASFVIAPLFLQAIFRRAYAISAGSSLLVCLVYLGFMRTPSETFSFFVWKIASTLLLHVLFFYVATRRLIPPKLWDRLHIRFAARTLSLLAIAQVLVFTAIGVYAQVVMSGRTRTGEAITSSPRLQSYEPTGSTIDSRNGAKLKVLSFNAWAVEGWIPQFIVSPSRDLEPRLRVIPRAIASLGPDLVVLQEVWKFQTRLRLIEDFRKLGYPHSIHGSDSVMSWFGIGNGLLIVSRLPLDPRIDSMTFSKATRVDEGPTFARKGVIKTRVNVGGGERTDRWIDVYATHLGGFTTREKNGVGYEFDSDEQEALAGQAEELGEFIKRTSKSEALLLAADLNAHPFTFENASYTLQPSKAYRALDWLVDSAAVTHPDTHASMFTYDPERNFYAKSGSFSYEPRGRIDYVFSKGSALVPVSTELVLDDVELSDHFGVLTTYELR